VVGARPGDLGDFHPPAGSRGKAKCEISVYFFNVYLYKILDLTNIRAKLGEYILQTHNTKIC